MAIYASATLVVKRLRRPMSRPIEEALRWGNAVAALEVARPGGARDLPSRAEVVVLLAAR